MANTRFFALILFLSLAGCTMSIESFGQTQDYVLKPKAGVGKRLELAGYDEAEYDKLISMDDDDYHDNQMKISFLLDDKQDTEQAESSIDLRACPHQCHGKCYDPLTHQCCNDILMNGYWSCPKCVHKCVDRCYPKGKGYKCCSGKVIPDAWPCCPHHCAAKCFNAETQKCCNDKIIDRNKICCKDYCGDNCYDPKTTSCCNGQVIDKNAKCCTSKCGQVCYDKATMKCCNNKIIPIAATCCSAAQRACGKTCYSPSTHQCCHNRLIPVGGPCCTSAQRACGKTCFSPSTHQCCHNRLIPVGGPCCTSAQRACGKKCYSPSTHQCCHNRLIPVGSLCCTSAQRACGKKCYSPSTHQCCHNRLIPVGSLCCTSAQRACGKKCYSPSTHKCCFGKVVPRSYRTCGKICYDPKKSKCCNNKKVTPLSSPCGCVRCGGVCINTRTQKCCHQRILLKSVPCISGSGNPLRITNGLNARRVGCYRDTWNRAIPPLEGKSYILIGNYRKRPFAMEKCALAAAKLGWSVFAVQHQGWCASSPTAGRTYKKYGRYNTCRNGKGGPWGNDVYVLEGKASKRTTRGDICVFPFIYKGKLYNGCTKVDHNRPWCAITPNYDVDRLWGNC